MQAGVMRVSQPDTFDKEEGAKGLANEVESLPETCSSCGLTLAEYVLDDGMPPPGCGLRLALSVMDVERPRPWRLLRLGSSFFDLVISFMPGVTKSTCSLMWLGT